MLKNKSDCECTDTHTNSANQASWAQVFCVWLTPNQDLAYVLATGYVAASILLSGFYLRISDMRLQLMRGLSWLSYTK